MQEMDELFGVSYMQPAPQQKAAADASYSQHPFEVPAPTSLTHATSGEALHLECIHIDLVQCMQLRHAATTVPGSHVILCCWTRSADNQA